MRSVLILAVLAHTAWADVEHAPKARKIVKIPPTIVLSLDDTIVPVPTVKPLTVVLVPPYPDPGIFLLAPPVPHRMIAVFRDPEPEDDDAGGNLLVDLGLVASAGMLVGVWWLATRRRELVPV